MTIQELHEESTTVFKRAFGIGMAFIGLIVGAGFASGREMLQFFVAFGAVGILGALIASLIMTFIAVAALQLGSHVQAKEHVAVFRQVSHPLIARFLDVTTVITLFAIGFVMFAGGGANMAQQFGWPVWVGAASTLVAVLVSGMFNVDKVARLIGLITPFLIVFLVGISAWTLATAEYDFAALDLAARTVPTSLPNWWLAALNYVGLCAISGVSMTIVIGGSMLDSRTAGLGGLIGGGIFLLLLMLAVLALFLSSEFVGDAELPMLALVNRVHPVLGTAMSIVVFGMIFNTALAMFYALGKRLTRSRPDRFRTVYVAVVLLGFALSFVGFRDLVAYVYPALGYLGLILIGVMAAGWVRGRSHLSAEARRRLHLRRLAARRLDPRHDFAPMHADLVQRLSGESHISDAELHAALIARTETALKKDPDVEYDPLPSEADASAILTQAEWPEKSQDRSGSPEKPEP
ncbi:hypothetical protein GRI75_10450 [Altererythrobacter soli]|uniref:Membrane protein YkvI n=1 Tax=Croceibacterium soli TaxID=1739690 RepID=A0A6I4UT13_9SPHN|nr:hypothetical protein [Croceibacterium soli]MXP42060.1 hypothetical protein [Croceibacterium soli]